MVAEMVWGFAAGLVLATITAPVGVSGAVFLLPFQLSVLNVPNPAVTPTNLLYNVIAIPGALLRYRQTGGLRQPLTLQLLVGTVPGVIVGAIARVTVLSGARSFRLVAGIGLIAMGGWLLQRTLRPAIHRRVLPVRAIVSMAFLVGVVGGVYGIGGGSVLSPILVGSGMAVGAVAPAALASTFVTSVVGALTFVALATQAEGSIAPDWRIGLACGLGGLVGGYLGTVLQPRVPERALRLLLGCLALTIGFIYLISVST